MHTKQWHVVQTVELGAPAQTVWDLVGGFFTIHKWHPDIAATEVLEDQTDLSAIRRRLTFPGQPKTIEELILMDNDDFHYRYKWHAGEWGERVQHYVASLRIIESEMSKHCIVQWSSTFVCDRDAVSDFYRNGFHALQSRFPFSN
jgi:Polyketide cyclase / dehydrase and lipid transport